MYIHNEVLNFTFTFTTLVRRNLAQDVVKRQVLVSISGVSSSGYKNDTAVLINVKRYCVYVTQLK
jgi:hypothetical protein